MALSGWQQNTLVFVGALFMFALMSQLRCSMNIANKPQQHQTARHADEAANSVAGALSHADMALSPSAADTQPDNGAPATQATSTTPRPVAVTPAAPPATTAAEKKPSVEEGVVSVMCVCVCDLGGLSGLPRLCSPEKGHCGREGYGNNGLHPPDPPPPAALHPTPPPSSSLPARCCDLIPTPHQLFLLLPPHPRSKFRGKDLGFAHMTRGYYDAGCNGKRLDYCRYVSTSTDPYFSCAIHGAEKEYTDRGVYQEADFDANKVHADCVAGGKPRVRLPPTTTAPPPLSDKLPDIKPARGPGKKPMVVVMLPMTSRGLQLSSLESTPMYRTALPTIVRTTAADKADFDVFVYAGYDKSDNFWHPLAPKARSYQHVEIRFIECDCDNMVCNTNCVMRKVWGGGCATTSAVPVSKSAHTPLQQQAYDDGADYFFRSNDDTEFVSHGWIPNFVKRLARMNPPNVGLVGPNCRQGNVAILTHDFTHRTHMEVRV